MDVALSRFTSQYTKCIRGLPLSVIGRITSTWLSDVAITFGLLTDTTTPYHFITKGPSRPLSVLGTEWGGKL